MSKKPWFKFNPTDWRDDEALRMCSIGARGLWIEMLCIMDRCEPRGHLLVKGRRPSVPQIAVMAGVTAEEAGPLLRELEEHEVFSRTQDSTIISRKMVKESRISATGREAVEKRWSAESEGDLLEPNRGLTCAGGAPPSDVQILRDSDSQRSESQRGRVAQARTAHPLPVGFPDQEAVQWAQQKCEAERVEVAVGRELSRFQDHHAAKGTLFKDWRAAWRTWIGNSIDWAKRDGKVVSIDAYRAPEPTPEQLAEIDQRRYRVWAEDYQRDPHGWRTERRGPPPGQPGCAIPPEILEEYGLPAVAATR